MKKIAILFVFVFWTAAAFAQLPLSTERVSVSLDGDSVRVVMRTVIPRRAVPVGMTVIHAPLITDGKWRVSLPPIIIQGRRAEIAWLRHEWAADTLSRHDEALYTENGKTVDYRAVIPFQHWMYGSRLEVETVMADCCETLSERSIVSGRILPPPPPPPEPAPVVVPPPPPPSTGDLLAETFKFVLPASEFDPGAPLRFYDDERDNALTIYYRINSHDIDAGYADNRQTLANLLAAIEVIQKSGDVRIDRVVIAGFASPEGPFAFNDRLAWDRAVAIKRFIMENSTMPDPGITIFNGSLDWRGLRLRVAADDGMPSQKEILELLDRRSDPEVQAGLMNRLRTMEGGLVWRRLADHIFPLLRNGAFIRVYFDELSNNGSN